MIDAFKKLFGHSDLLRVPLVGLSPEGERDAGEQLIAYFGIPVGRENDAVRDIVALLNSGAEVSLTNNCDEGKEGTTAFRRVHSQMESKIGGHGWQGDWKPIDEPGVLASVIELAPLNRGGHWSKRVSVTQSKKRA